MRFAWASGFASWPNGSEAFRNVSECCSEAANAKLQKLEKLPLVGRTRLCCSLPGAPMNLLHASLLRHVQPGRRLHQLPHLPARWESFEFACCHLRDQNWHHMSLHARHSLQILASSLIYGPLPQRKAVPSPQMPIDWSSACLPARYHSSQHPATLESQDMRLKLAPSSLPGLNAMRRSS